MLLNGENIPTKAICDHTCSKPSIYATCYCFEFDQTLATLVEKFIMLTRSRSCTHHVYVMFLH
jgi:hypothetical protein